MPSTCRLSWLWGYHLLHSRFGGSCLRGSFDVWGRSVRKVIVELTKAVRSFIDSVEVSGKRADFITHLKDFLQYASSIFFFRIICMLWSREVVTRRCKIPFSLDHIPNEDSIPIPQSRLLSWSHEPSIELVCSISSNSTTDLVYAALASSSHHIHMSITHTIIYCRPSVHCPPSGRFPTKRPLPSSVSRPGATVHRPSVRRPGARFP